MFGKFSALALFAPLVAGLTLNEPQNLVSGGTTTISWTASATDNTFSLELLNDIFHNAFAIANNVLPTDGSITLTIPVVPIGAGYTLVAVDIGNINNVYASTGTFSIGANPNATATSTASTTSTGTHTGSTTSLSGSTSTSPSLSTQTYGTTITTPVSSSTSTGSGSATTTPSAFNGAATLKVNTQVGAFAAVLFSAVAGAAVFVL